MFRQTYPLAWMFHQNTCRFPSNVHGIADTSGKVAPFKEYFSVPRIALPEPVELEATLDTAIKNRLACRRFLAEPLAIRDVATMLKHAYGVHNHLHLAELEFLERPVPSGGGLYPLEMYLLVLRIDGLDQGVYHYSARDHHLDHLRALQLPPSLISDLFMSQPYVADCAAIVVIAAVLERSLWKYEDRGYRYILFEAGHVAQNINLLAAAMNGGSLNLGGFFDGDMARLLALDPEEEIPLYGIAIGVPSRQDRSLLRQPAA